MWNAPSTSRTSVVPSGRSHSASVQRRRPSGRVAVADDPGGAGRSGGTCGSHRARRRSALRRRCRRSSGGTCERGATDGAARPMTTSRSGVVSRCWTAAARTALAARRTCLVAGVQQRWRARSGTGAGPGVGRASGRTAVESGRTGCRRRARSSSSSSHQDRDLRSIPAPKAVHPGGRQAPEHAARPGVEDPQPEPLLLPGERPASSYRSRAGVCTDPPARSDLVAHPNRRRRRAAFSCRRATIACLVLSIERSRSVLSFIAGVIPALVPRSARSGALSTGRR